MMLVIAIGANQESRCDAITTVPCNNGPRAKLVGRVDAARLWPRHDEIRATTYCDPLPFVCEHKTMSGVPVAVELLTTPPDAPSAWQPGPAEPRLPSPARPGLSPRLAYVMQKVLRPNPANRGL